MNYQTKIIVSTSLLNHRKSFSTYPRVRAAYMEKQAVPEEFRILMSNRNLPKNEEDTTPPQSGPIDSINSPKERRKGGPQEEFIEPDPNFSKKMSEEEKKDIRNRSRNEDKKGN